MGSCATRSSASGSKSSRSCGCRASTIPTRCCWRPEQSFFVREKPQTAPSQCEAGFAEPAVRHCAVRSARGAGHARSVLRPRIEAHRACRRTGQAGDRAGSPGHRAAPGRHTGGSDGRSGALSRRHAQRHLDPAAGRCGGRCRGGARHERRLVTFYWRGWRADVSLNLFLGLLVGTCFVLVTAIQAAHSLVGLPQRAREWRVARRDRSAQAALRDALAQYFGGRYGRAQKAAQRALTIQADTPELVQDDEFHRARPLLAAGSAHRLQDRSGRDEQLKRALDLSTPQRCRAIGRRGRAAAGRRMGPRRSGRSARDGTARRIAVGGGAAYPRASSAAAGHTPGPPTGKRR